MSFRRYLDENRGLFADHRLRPPGPGLPLDEDAPVLDDPGSAVGNPPGLRGRRRVRERAPARGHYRHVMPAYAPSIWHEPLPYEEPIERMLR